MSADPTPAPTAEPIRDGATKPTRGPARKPRATPTVHSRPISAAHVTDDPVVGQHYRPAYRVSAPSPAKPKSDKRAPVGLGGLKPQQAFAFFYWLLGTLAFEPLTRALCGHADTVVLNGERRGEARRPTRHLRVAGRPRVLDGRAVLAAAFAVGATTPSRMQVSAVTELLGTELSEDLKTAIGYLREDGSHVSHATIHRYLTAIVHGAGAVNHNHPILVNGRPVNPSTGETADHLVTSKITVADLTECGRTCPGHGGIQGITNQFLTRLHDHLGTPDNGLLAIDSFPIETHYAAKTHGSLTEIDPQNLPDTITDDTEPGDTP